MHMTWQEGWIENQQSKMSYSELKPRPWFQVKKKNDYIECEWDVFQCSSSVLWTGEMGHCSALVD